MTRDSARGGFLCNWGTTCTNDEQPWQPSARVAARDPGGGSIHRADLQCAARRPRRGAQDASASGSESAGECHSVATAVPARTRCCSPPSSSPTTPPPSLLRASSPRPAGPRHRPGRRSARSDRLWWRRHEPGRSLRRQPSQPSAPLRVARGSHSLRRQSSEPPTHLCVTQGGPSFWQPSQPATSLHFT